MAGQMMAVRKKMGLTVRELLLAEEMKDIKVLAGDRGLDKEIKGVTIIEAPDIVKFIDGGEVLLTGLYAFRSCTVDERAEQKECQCPCVKAGQEGGECGHQD